MITSELILQNLISAAVMAAVFGSIFKFYFDRFLMDKSSKAVTNGKIIDKRLEAIDRISELLQLTTSEVRFERSEDSYFEVFESKSKYLEFKKMLDIALKQNFWVTNELYSKIQQLRNLLIPIKDDFSIDQVKGKFHFHMRETCLEITEEFNKEILKINRVEELLTDNINSLLKKGEQLRKHRDAKNKSIV